MEGIGLALSGGGHRATLFAAGALLAIVDRGLNKRVEQIASVSGGSLTNAFVALRCDFGTLNPGEFDSIARALIDRVANEGVLTRPRIVVFLGAVGTAASGAFAIGQALAAAFAHSACAAVTVGLVAGVVAGCAVLLLCGNYIERLINRVYLTASPELVGAEGTADTGSSRTPTLGRVPPRKVEHVFCATDLVLGAPVYASTAAGGRLWRRTGVLPDIGHASSTVVGQLWGAADLTLAEVVRSSAAFPGIPPRRLRFPDPETQDYRRSKLRRLPLSRGWFGHTLTDDELAERDAKRRQGEAAFPRVAFLADGGLWNNLATHCLREDCFVNGEQSIAPSCILCINASAPSSRTAGASVSYYLPGLAAVTWLLRDLSVLSTNTVAPRVAAMMGSVRRRTLRLARSDANDPLDVVADLRDVSQTEVLVGGLAQHRQDIARSDPAVQRWESASVDTQNRPLMDT